MTTAERLPPILIVEDSDEDYDTVQEAVRKSGLSLEVRRALTGGACLQILHQAHGGRPVLVLMDLNTPGTDGREALAVIKSDPALKSTPVVVFSTSAAPRDLEYCYANGANAYHVKPVRYPDHLAMLLHLFSYWFGQAVMPSGGPLS